MISNPNPMLKIKVPPEKEHDFKKSSPLKGRSSLFDVSQNNDQPFPLIELMNYQADGEIFTEVTLFDPLADVPHPYIKAKKKRFAFDDKNQCELKVTFDKQTAKIEDLKSSQYKQVLRDKNIPCKVNGVAKFLGSKITVGGKVVVNDRKKAKEIHEEVKSNVERIKTQFRIKMKAYQKMNNGEGQRFLASAISDVIIHKKEKTPLSISRINSHIDGQNKGDEVWIACDGVEDHQVKIQFHDDDWNPEPIIGVVENQVLVTFKRSELPPYKTQIDMGRSVEVKMRLVSMEDHNHFSNSYPFEYRGTSDFVKPILNHKTVDPDFTEWLNQLVPSLAPLQEISTRCPPEMQHNANNMVGLSCSNHQQPALSEIPPQSSNVLMEKETSVHASSNNLQSLSELYEMIKECCSNTASHDIVTPCESENGGDTVAFDQNSMVLIDETIGGEDDEGQPLSFGSTITISSDNENEDGDGKYEISANPPPNGFVALQGQCNNYLTSNVDPNVIMMPHNTNLEPNFLTETDPQKYNQFSNTQEIYNPQIPYSLNYQNQPIYPDVDILDRILKNSE